MSALLSPDKTRISNPLICDDTLVTLATASMMGATISRGQELEITGPDRIEAPATEINCEDSGTTLRFFTALSALTDGKCVLTGNKSLLRRPIKDLIFALHQLGVRARLLGIDDCPPVEVHGGEVVGGNIAIRGDISSQYISGLLFTCSRALQDSTLEITTKLMSRPYVEVTIEVMAHFGVKAEPHLDWRRIYVPGNQRYRSDCYEVNGDYSSAAFLLAAGVLSGEVTVHGLRRHSTQGDAMIVRVLDDMGALLRRKGNAITVTNSELGAFDIDLSQTPDLMPVLSLLATQAHGTSRIRGVERLRYKESDRLNSVTRELGKMGANIRMDERSLSISGPTQLRGTDLHSHGDHRIAMTNIIAGLIAAGETTVEDADCISKSYPGFLEHMQILGAQLELMDGDGRSGG